MMLFGGKYQEVAIGLLSRLLRESLWVIGSLELKIGRKAGAPLGSKKLYMCS